MKIEMTEYYISTDKSLLDHKKICYLLSGCFWSKNIPIEYVSRFIQYSLCFGVYQNDNVLIGFGRVISDYTTYAYICDVVIDPNHRKKGLGSKLINSIMSHNDLRGLKTWSLRTTKEAKKIYLRKEFQKTDHPDTQLEINNLDIYTSPDFCNLYKELI
jgi:GNAT superfamily N-acetyltransferase